MKYLLITVLFTVMLPSQVFAKIELDKALRCDGVVIDKTPEQQRASLSLSKVVRDRGIKLGGKCLGWTNRGSGNYWYVAARDIGIFAIDVSSDKYIGSWPLKRWKHDFIEPEFLSVLKSYDFEDYFNEASLYEPSFGCLSDNPLRYGDIDGSGPEELFLFLGNTMLVFSPEKESIVFSSNFGIHDWLDEEETIKHFESWGSQPSDKDPQYQSKLSRESVNTWNARFPGYRGHAKFYFGDFNDDGSMDILVWRKLYISRLRGDSVQGFKPVGETLLHYTMKNDEYSPVETEESLIKAWLQNGNWTWKKGFPSENECEGEEDELIPEMHDPLLNDPDVLQ